MEKEQQSSSAASFTSLEQKIDNIQRDHQGGYVELLFFFLYIHAIFFYPSHYTHIYTDKLEQIESKKAEGLAFKEEIQDLKEIRYELERAGHVCALQLNQIMIDHLDAQNHLEQLNKDLQKLEAYRDQLMTDASDVDQVRVHTQGSPIH